jgi:hypothetical protein
MLMKGTTVPFAMLNTDYQLQLLVVGICILGRHDTDMVS